MEYIFNDILIHIYCDIETIYRPDYVTSLLILLNYVTVLCNLCNLISYLSTNYSSFLPPINTNLCLG